MQHSRWFGVLLTALMLMSPARAQDQLDELPLATDGSVVIRHIEWGFDGKAVERTFTPLSVLVQNNTAAPVSGTLKLTKHLQLNQRIDAEYVQTYYVSGFSSRWVQLTPYVIDDYETWTLSWGEARNQRAEIPTPRVGERATVLIHDPEAVQIAGGVLRRCDQALFPVSVTGTDGLRGVVFDRPPDWQGAREQAFLEWLRRGGRVFLLDSPDGGPPRFKGDLAILNQPDERFPIGSGAVYRIPLPAAEIDYDTAASLIFRAEPAESLIPRTTLAMTSSGSTFREVVPFGGAFGWDQDRQLFIDLQQAARFHRHWWLIYLVVLVYLLALYPGCYLLGRRVPDWRVFYAGFLGVCVLFSTGFATLGQVGGGEFNRVRSVAIARQLDSGLYDVTQWSCLAAVNGDLYSVQHGGSGRLYSSCQELEPVNGQVLFGEGRFDVDLPPASTRTLLHRMRIDGPELGVQIRDVQIDERGLSRFAASVSPRLEARAAYVWHKGQIYELQQLAATNEWSSTNRGEAGITFLNSFTDYWATANARWAGLEDEDQRELDQVFQGMLRNLIGNSFNLDSQVRPEDVILPDDRVRVFVYAPAPDEFNVLGDRFPDQRGFVLYILDLPLAVDLRPSD
jgi:hypothetical protein